MVNGIQRQRRTAVNTTGDRTMYENWYSVVCLSASSLLSPLPTLALLVAKHKLKSNPMLANFALSFILHHTSAAVYRIQ